jgi:osmotically-inducible protein OsmY
MLRRSGNCLNTVEVWTVTRLLSTVIISAALMSGCARTTESPAVADKIRTALKQQNIKDVSVSQDREKGVVTLDGAVQAAADKARAGQIAQSLAAGQVVANEIAIVPPGDASQTKTIYADLDKGIDNNLAAALISGGYKNGIGHKVKNGVIVLNGSVDNEAQRDQISQIARTVPNVQQVVNEIGATHEKATSDR